MFGSPVYKYATQDQRTVTIRKYRPEDRPRVRWICSETGFVGKPQETVFEGREVFADLWSSYYTDREPHLVFVAEVDGQVEGYLLGCLDSRRQSKIWSREILPAAALKMARTGWFKNPKNRRYVMAMLRSRFRKEMTADESMIFREYPAHLHINIGRPEMRGIGAGKKLMLAYLDLLRENRVSGVHLGTTSHNRQAVPFYERMGFSVIHSDVVTFFDHAIDDPPLHVLHMGMKL